MSHFCKGNNYATVSDPVEQSSPGLIVFYDDLIELLNLCFKVINRMAEIINCFRSMKKKYFVRNRFTEPNFKTYC